MIFAEEEEVKRVFQFLVVSLLRADAKRCILEAN